MARKEATLRQALKTYDYIYVDDLIEAVYRLSANDTNKAFYYIGSGSPRIPAIPPRRGSPAEDAGYKPAVSSWRAGHCARP